MNCIFCNKPVSYLRFSLRFSEAYEYFCEHCLVGNDLMDDFSLNHWSNFYVHLNQKKEILFQDISIGHINMEHDYVEETTKIGEWKKNYKSDVELINYATIPLALNLNSLSLEDLKKKIKLYITFS